MILPPFSDFLSSLDSDKLDYDLSLYSSASLKEPRNPFSIEEYEIIVQTNLAITKALLAAYHQWLNEQLPE